MARSIIYEILGSPATSDSMPVSVGTLKRVLEELLTSMTSSPAPLSPPPGIQG